MNILKTFTLIELILVVAIVAVLAGAMVPLITSARQEARAAKFAQLVDTLTTACRLYYSDTGRYAVEYSSYPSTSWSGHRLSVRPNFFVSGWDGPYLSKPLLNEDISIKCRLGCRAWIIAGMVTDFDLDGDNNVDKVTGVAGNSMTIFGILESEAKTIDSVMDRNIPGDWRITGKVKITSPTRAAIYLTGGS